jgi:hypothetical protein
MHMKKLTEHIRQSVLRCRIYVISIFSIYCFSCSIGILMSQRGNEAALDYRDKIVGKAIKSDFASLNYQKGNRFKAAMIDFSGNLCLSAIPQTLMGFGIVIPYFSAAFQGWVGGIVSVDSAHKSRFKSFRSTLYYFLVLLLQYIPYSLALGSGIKCGIDFYNDNKKNDWSVWKFRLQKTSLIDVGYVYLLVIPLFLIASCFEFISTWNM